MRFFFSVFALSLIAGAAQAAPLVPAADLVVRDAPQPPTRPSVVVPSAEWMRVSARGVVVAGVTTTRSNGVLAGDAGKAFVYPGRIPLPVFDVSPSGTEFSPDGRYLLVASNQSWTRAAAGGAVLPANPSTVVLSMPGARVVQRFVGFDPRWTGSGTVVFRRGTQAYRVDIGHEPVAVGVAQPAFRCTSESFGPQTPCRDSWYSNLLGQDPASTFWVTSTYFGGLQSAGTFERVEMLDLRSGVSRTLFQVADPQHQQDLALWLDSVSPSAKRTCSWSTSPAVAELLCATLPSGAPERIVRAPKRADEAVWLDDDRMLITGGGTVELLDLSAGTRTRVVGLAAGSRWMTALPGGNRVVFAKPSVHVLDLQARTSSDLGTQSSWVITPVPAAGRGFYVTSEVPDHLTSYSWLPG